MKKIGILTALLLLILVPSVLADGLSVQLKRTNPGIANVKSAELIFDVVNTDFGNEIEGFLFCKSSDDITISSTLGAGSGSGAQYISPKFEMNPAPSQKSMSLVIESYTEGNKRTGCILKYIPYTVKETRQEIFDEALNETKIIIEKEKTYYKMNGECISVPLERDYRELRLDKTVPFVKEQRAVDVFCPEGQTNCKSDEVKVSRSNTIKYGLIGLILLILLALAYLLGKVSRRS